MTDAPDVGDVISEAVVAAQQAVWDGSRHTFNWSAVERAAVRAAVRYAKEQVGLAFEEAATVADPHWPESGHVHQDGDLSCQATISVEIRRMKRGAMESKVLAALAKMEDDHAA